MTFYHNIKIVLQYFFIERYSLHFNPETCLFQVGLGIATLLFYVPVPLASLHQCGALVTMSSALWCQFYKTFFYLSPALKPNKLIFVPVKLFILWLML
jgi:Cytochrome oxidase assembly protein